MTSMLHDGWSLSNAERQLQIKQDRVTFEHQERVVFYLYGTLHR